MNRLLIFILNLYYIFTGIFLLLKDYNMVLYFWVLSWLLYFLISHLKADNDKDN